MNQARVLEAAKKAQRAMAEVRGLTREEGQLALVSLLQHSGFPIKDMMLADIEASGGGQP